MAVYPSAHRILANLSGVWTDLTGYVIDDITGSWGIRGNGPLDLLADTGVMRFALNNMDQRFTPGHPSALGGWEKDIAIRLEIDYDGDTYMHQGTIEEIDIPLDQDLVDRAFVTVHDWLKYSARDPIVNPGILTGERGDDVIRTVLSLMPIQPAATDLDVGVSVFPTTFDTVTSQTKAYSELSKVAFSEPGLIYLRKDRVYGETLVFESAHARHGLRALSALPLGSAESGALLKEDGGYLLKEDGGKILLNQTGEFFADNSMIDVDTDYGKQVINYFTLQANPRKLDASPQVLFGLSTPIPIASGQALELKGTYADPAGGLPINAQGMITPAATTDYLFNSAEDGSGTALTGSLVLVATPFGTEGFTHLLRNDSASMGWLRQYNTRGYGIYNYNPVTSVAKDQDSIERRGTHTETLDQKYQSSLAYGRSYVEAVVDEEKEPRTVLNNVTFLANESPALMMAFLNFGPGNLIRIKHDRRGIDDYFYIQGISDFKITSGGLIMFTWIVKKILTLACGLSPLAVGFRGNTTQDVVDFGYLPHVYSENTGEEISLSLWFYADSFPTVPDKHAVMVGATTNEGGWRLYISSSVLGELRFYHNIFNSQPGFWGANTTTINLETWYHVVVTMNLSSINNDPIVYVNGTSVMLNEVNTPSGSKFTRSSIPILVGNHKSATVDYAWGFNGKIFDPRIYNRILTPGEVTTLYNGGTPDETLLRDSSLVFQPFYVPTKRLAQYIDATLTSSLKVRDGIFGVMGTPHGAPIGRSAP